MKLLIKIKNIPKQTLKNLSGDIKLLIEKHKIIDYYVSYGEIDYLDEISKDLKKRADEITERSTKWF